jgi:class 3 adenylate cyclase/tetratricopeptide (TPR) repeat protein
MSVPATGRQSRQQHEAEAELRRVTVLFADIQGSTTLIQGLDPEQAAQLIDPVLRTMIDAVERFDGVASHRGDGIMAIFGAPSVSEDHGVRACLAALAIRDGLAGHTQVRARIGIHVGDVVFRPVRIGRSWSQDAVGIAVHIAARLEQTAEPGSICLSEAVWRFARGFVNAAPLEPISVRGVDLPIARYALLDADGSTDRWAVRAASGLGRFVGREHERAVLAAALAAGVAGNTGDAAGGLRTILLQGPAGIGKSRLLHEFLQSAPAQACQVIALRGDLHRRSVPFHPVATWLRGWLDIRSADPAGESRGKLAGIDAAGTALDETDRELIGRLLGLADSAPDIATRSEIAQPDFGATMARLIGLIAGGRQVILVTEDLDWFDVASRKLLDSTLTRLVRREVLLLVTSRSRVRLTVILPAQAMRSLTLGPLTDADAATLLGSIDPALIGNAALAGSILRKAGGNPLFLEEVTPLIARHGAGSAAPGLDDATSLEIPDRVDALIADRLARLPRQSRRLVQLCAVVGFEVNIKLLAALSDISAAELRPQLLKLQSEQLLYESRRYPDPQFTFKHALTRDVAYRTILATRRRAYHARIVGLLEAEDEPERNADELCLHALQAQLWPEAVGFLQIAARQAVARGAIEIARSYLGRAREVAAGLADDDAMARTRLDILNSLQVLITWVGSYTELGPLLDEAHGLAERLGDTRAQARILAARVHMLNILGRLDDAIALGRQTRESARKSGDINMMVTATFFTGQSYFNAGHLQAAERCLSENLLAMATPAEAAPAGTDVLQMHYSRRTMLPLTHGTRALARCFLGDFHGAAEDVTAMTSLAHGTGRAYDRLFALTVGGLVELQQRRAPAAEAILREGLALSEADNISQLNAPMLAGLGHALLLRGDLDEASRTLNMAYRLARDTSRAMFQISAATGLAWTSLRLGEPDLARGFADEAVALAARLGFHGYRVPAMRAQGLILVGTSGLEDSGVGVLRAALALAKSLAMRAEIAHGLMSLAAADGSGRDSHLSEAGARYAALGMTGWFTTARAAIAEGRLPYL